MKIGKMALALVVLLGVSFRPAAAQSEQSPPAAEGESPLRAAIFVQNRAGMAYQEKIDVLNDLISARLTERGFSILDKQYVLDKFREARDPDQEAKKLITALSGGRIDLNVEEALKDASALRLAQMIGADYMIVAALTSLGHTEKKFSGAGTIHGVDNAVTDYTLRVSLRVLEAAQGGSLYGNVVRANERIARTENLEIASSDILNSLLDSASEKIAANIAGKAERIRSARVEAVSYVPFTISVTGPDFAVVELDGAVIGSAGRDPVQFLAPPGIHMMRVNREWFAPWSRPVNIQADQNLKIALEFSQEGLARYKDLENFKRLMAEDADAYAKRQIADGERKRREESYTRIDTSKVERLSTGDRVPRVIIEEED